jgi:HlyD family secretion protein
MLRVSSPLGWMTLLAVTTAFAISLVLSCISTAAVKVDGRGILLAAGGVVDIPSPADGRLLSRRVEIGDDIKAGDVVAELAQPDNREQLQSKQSALESLRDERKQLVAFQSQVAAADTKLNSEREESLKARIQSLTARAAVLSDLQRNLQTLFDSGVATRGRLLDAQADRTRNDNDLAEARGALLQIASEAQARETQNERELLANQTKIDTLGREIDLMRGALSRSTVVLAPADGRISEIEASTGEMVHAGAPLFRMLPNGGDQAELLARLYVSGGDGKRVKVGMSAQIVPSTARLQRDGFMEGEVIRVAELPTTPESMQSALKNSALVKTLTSEGPPYEVLVRLLRDPTSPSGFKWSTGRGTPSPPDGGTIADARFVVDQIPLIALVIPRTETVLGWLRI